MNHKETHRQTLDSAQTQKLVVASGQPIACDGGGGALGHPRVFLTADESGVAECPYCGRSFVCEGDKAQTGHKA